RERLANILKRVLNTPPKYLPDKRSSKTKGKRASGVLVLPLGRELPGQIVNCVCHSTLSVALTLADHHLTVPKKHQLLVPRQGNINFLQATQSVTHNRANASANY